MRIALLAVLILILAFSGCSGAPSSTLTISVSPSSANVSVGEKGFFQATLGGNTQTTVTWQVNGIPGGNSTVGTISFDGTPDGTVGAYTAPATIPSPPTVVVTAVAQANPNVTASATAKIGPLVSVSPPLPIVRTYETQQFSATVTGASNTAVTWQINCTAGGPACGAIDQTGLYKTPNSVPTKVDGNTRVQEDVAVTAVSQADPAFSGSVFVTVVSFNQQAQSTPILLGTSGSNANDICSANNSVSCTAGTLGALLARGGKQYILSNNHVLARFDAAALGEAATQPGLVDTRPFECDTTRTTTVANLAQFSPLRTGTGTKVDAAIAEVVLGAVDPNGQILELGSTVVNGVPQPGAPAAGVGIPASINELVAKSGRPTGLTCANVEAINLSFKAQFQPLCSTTSFTLSFSNQVAVGGTAFSAAGDSGSLIVDGNTAEPVALLFAGDASTTIGNPISDVLNALKDANSNTPTFVGGAPHPVAACSLPPPSATSAAQALPVVSEARLRMASQVKERHVAELLAKPGVAAVGIGASLDAPGQPAILIFVQGDSPQTSFPPEVEGLRTRILESEAFTLHGSLDHEESAQLVLQASHKPPSALPEPVIQSAIAIKERHAAQLMRNPAVRGVGVSASLDNPGDAVLILYMLLGHVPTSLPIVIDGLRTRIKETPGFRAGVLASGPGVSCSAASVTKPSPVGLARRTLVR